MNIVLDGDCARCPYRRNCMASCAAAKQRTDRIKAEEDANNRKVKRALAEKLLRKERNERYELPDEDMGGERRNDHPAGND